MLVVEEGPAPDRDILKVKESQIFAHQSKVKESQTAAQKSKKVKSARSGQNTT